MKTFLGTIYDNGDPLTDDSGKRTICRLNYLVEKFPYKPWRIKLSYKDNELREIDSWLNEQDLNMFGDPKGRFWSCILKILIIIYFIL